MIETIFSFDQRNYLDCQERFRGSRNQEYYLGQYSIDAGAVIEVRADKKAVSSSSIIRLRSRSRLTFRRSWSHIREDGTDVMVLWFVKRGALRISHQCGSCVAQAGDFVITKSTSPFFMECQTDSESVHEVLHVIVPTHVISRYMSKDVRTGFTVPAAGLGFRIAERLLQDIFEDVDELPEHIGQLLFESALAVLTDAIIGCENYAQERDTVSGARLKDVLKFIEVHLSDPKLSTKMVAEACGISQRYLSRLLGQNKTPFSVLVWDQRLKIAHRWLSTSKPSETTIAEIAFRVGFKSPAHFSRIFKQAYSCGPREFREERHARVPAGREVYSTDFVVNTIQ